MGGNGDGTAAVHRLGRDPDALEEFYRRHVAEVTRFVARRVPDAHTAADLTTEVFLQVIECAERYRGGPGGTRGWLFGIARNVVNSAYRDDARRRRHESRLAGHRALDADELGRVEEQLDAARDAAALAPELAALAPGDRAVLDLVTADGLTVTEPAAVLGIRPGAARIRLHRARRIARRVRGTSTGPLPTTTPDSDDEHQEVPA